MPLCESVLRLFLTYWFLERQRTRFVATTYPTVTDAVEMENGLMPDYQAQLTAAIWESRMLAGRGGIADAPERNETQGVSEDAKTRWKRYEHREAMKETATEKTLLKKNNEDKLTCSICLCEYESGELKVRLPCGHVYHHDCLSSWTRNHVRCPLCNLDLESSNSDAGANAVPAAA